MSYYKLLNKGTEASVEISANSIEKLFVISFSTWLETVSDQNKYGLEIKDVEFHSDNHDSLLKEFLNQLNNLLNSKKWLTIDVEDLSIKNDDKGYLLKASFKGKNINAPDIKIKKVIKNIAFNGKPIDFSSGYFSINFVYEL